MKFLLPAFFLLLNVSSSAQKSVVVFGGAQSSTASFSINNQSQSTSSKTGFVAGLGGVFPIEGPLVFSPSVSYNRRGYQATFTRRSSVPDSAAINSSTTINALQLAPLLQLNFGKRKTHLFIRGAPVFTINLSGTETFDTAANKRVVRPIPFSYDKYGFITASAMVQLGLQTKAGLQVFAFYEHGLSNLSNADLGPSILERVAGVCIGWRFGK